MNASIGGSVESLSGCECKLGGVVGDDNSCKDILIVLQKIEIYR